MFTNVLEIRQFLVKGGVGKHSGRPWNAVTVVGFLKCENGQLRSLDDLIFSNDL